MKCATVLLLAASLQAQIGIIRPNEPPVSEPLRQYLELTFAQVTALTDLGTQLNQFQMAKAQRMAQVQRELADEMQRESPDPMALGQRHLELEVIRREITREQQRSAEQIQQIFTPAQRTKIAALQEVLRQYPLACEAMQRNLVPAPQPMFQQVPQYLYVPTCMSSGIRTGDFAFPIIAPPPNVR